MTIARNRPIRWGLWACVALLLLGFAVRAHAIETLPPFNDESHHIRRAEGVYTFTDRDLNLTLGKLFSYYWIGLFGAQRLDAIFIARTASALFALLGLAGTFITARLLYNRRAGVLALALLAFSPFMIFFDRLALADGLTAALAVLLVGASIKLVRAEEATEQRGWAVLTGALCGLVVIAKLLGLPLVAVPLLAVLSLGRVRPPRRWGWANLRCWLGDVWAAYRPQLVTVYATLGLLMVPFIWHIFDRVANGQHLPIVNNNLINVAAQDKAPLQVVWDNLGTVWETGWLLHGSGLWLVMLAAAGWAIWQRTARELYLLGGLALAWSLSVVWAAELSTRYLTLGVPLALILVAGQVEALSRHAAARLSGHDLWRMLPAGLVVVWLAVHSLPFIATAWTQPAALHLPARDRWEYYENFSAGYGLVDAAADLERLPRSQPSGRVAVLGLVGSCHQLRLYLDEHGPVWLECPFFGWQGEYMDTVAATVQARAAAESHVYLLVEPVLPFTDLARINVRWELIERYPRPGDGMVVELYRVYPPAESAEQSPTSF